MTIAIESPERNWRYKNHILEYLTRHGETPLPVLAWQVARQYYRTRVPNDAVIPAIHDEIQALENKGILTSNEDDEYPNRRISLSDPVQPAA